MSIDNGILSTLHSERGLKGDAPWIESTYADYPLYWERSLDGMNMPVLFGAFYFMFANLSVFAILIPIIIREKVDKLRIGMHVFGVSSSSHWFSWTIVSSIFCSTLAFSIPFFAWMCRFEMFLWTPFLVMFGFFLINSLTYVMFGFLISTIVSTKS